MGRGFTFAAALLLLAGCQQHDGGASQTALTNATSPAAADDVKVGLQILDLDGIQKLVASHRGKLVVLDAWSTSCAPCVKEFPELVALSRRYEPQRLACISLSFDYEGIGTPDEQAPRVLKFLELQHATFDNVLSSEDSDVLYRKLGLASVPAVFVYDRDGKLRKRFDNENARGEADTFTYQQVNQLVAELIEEQPATESKGEGDSPRHERQR